MTSYSPDMQPRIVLLFLDFDGVLHPYAPWPHDEKVRAGYFQHLPRLENVLRDFSGVRVVVSSDWRRHHRLEDLRLFFSEDLRHRVIGTTSQESISAETSGSRQLQVEEYLRNHNLIGTPWIAIDDTSSNYFPQEERLVLCADMFGEQEEAVLRILLQRLGRDFDRGLAQVSADWDRRLAWPQEPGADDRLRRMLTSRDPTQQGLKDIEE